MALNTRIASHIPWRSIILCWSVSFEFKKFWTWKKIKESSLQKSLIFLAHNYLSSFFYYPSHIHSGRSIYMELPTAPHTPWFFLSMLFPASNIPFPFLASFPFSYFCVNLYLKTSIQIDTCAIQTAGPPGALRHFSAAPYATVTCAGCLFLSPWNLWSSLSSYCNSLCNYELVSAIPLDLPEYRDCLFHICYTDAKLGTWHIVVKEHCTC